MQSSPHIGSGKLRALGVATRQRVAALPDVPTIDESGLPGYEASNWWGIVYPARTPQSIVARIDKELGSILMLPDVKKRFLADGAEPHHVSQGEFGKFIAAETAKWARVVKVAGIKPQ